MDRGPERREPVGEEESLNRAWSGSGDLLACKLRMEASLLLLLLCE